jgi:signal transduction histidine kinase
MKPPRRTQIATTFPTRLVSELERYGPRHELWLSVLRLALLIVATALIAFSGGFSRVLPAIVAVAFIDVVMSLPLRMLRTPPAAVFEGVAVAAIATAPEPASGNLMLCFLAPALAAGIRGSYRWTLAATAALAVVGAAQILRVPTDFDAAGLIDLFRWTALSLALGSMAAWYRLQVEDEPSRPYAEALRVLTELDAISRRLPAGLDVGTIGARALEEAVDRCGTDRAVLVIVNSLGSLEVVATFPAPGQQAVERLGDWDAWADLAASGEPTQRTTPDGALVMCPLRVSARLVGYVLLNCEKRLDRERLHGLADAVQQNAVPLEAALLFTGVRDLATNEERSRIAREIHDGIAQDVAFLGYAADEIIDLAEDEQTHQLAVELRSQITRVVGELRRSVFTLREGVGPTESLGGTLGNHARRIFRDSNVQLHLTVDESPNRLRPEVQSEVLRMGQEALTNARRHANARNVWVTCVIDAPAASVVVEDDGVGLGGRGADSYGMEIMRERAARVHADLRVSNRPDGGTTVRISI